MSVNSKRYQNLAESVNKGYHELSAKKVENYEIKHEPHPNSVFDNSCKKETSAERLAKTLTVCATISAVATGAASIATALAPLFKKSETKPGFEEISGKGGDEDTETNSSSDLDAALTQARDGGVWDKKSIEKEIKKVQNQVKANEKEIKKLDSQIKEQTTAKETQEKSKADLNAKNENIDTVQVDNVNKEYETALHAATMNYETAMADADSWHTSALAGIANLSEAEKAYPKSQIEAQYTAKKEAAEKAKKAAEDKANETHDRALLQLGDQKKQNLSQIEKIQKQIETIDAKIQELTGQKTKLTGTNTQLTQKATDAQKELDQHIGSTTQDTNINQPTEPVDNDKTGEQLVAKLKEQAPKTDGSGTISEYDSYLQNLTTAIEVAKSQNKPDAVKALQDLQAKATAEKAALEAKKAATTPAPAASATPSEPALPPAQPETTGKTAKDLENAKRLEELASEANSLGVKLQFDPRMTDEQRITAYEKIIKDAKQAQEAAKQTPPAAAQPATPAAATTEKPSSESAEPSIPAPSRKDIEDADKKSSMSDYARQEAEKVSKEAQGAVDKAKADLEKINKQIEELNKQTNGQYIPRSLTNAKEVAEIALKAKEAAALQARMMAN